MEPELLDGLTTLADHIQTNGVNRSGSRASFIRRVRDELNRLHELEAAAAEFGHWDEVLAGPETLWPDNLMDLHTDAYFRLVNVCRAAAKARKE
jgi:hypothetical protein